MEYGGRLKSKLENNSFKNTHTSKKTHKNIDSTYSMKISKTQDVFKITFKVASGGYLALYCSSTIKLENNTSARFCIQEKPKRQDSINKDMHRFFKTPFCGHLGFKYSKTSK